MSIILGISHSGTISLGQDVSCDGYEPMARLGIYTHVHADHIAGFESSLLGCEKVLVSSQTMELLKLIKGSWLESRRNLVSLDPGYSLELGPIRIEFSPSGHMLGAIQVVVERPGLSLGYTSDFLLERAKPIKPDVLVIDSSYGSPSCVRGYSRSDSERMLIKLVSEAIEEKPVQIIAPNFVIHEAIHTIASAVSKCQLLTHDHQIHLISQAYAKLGFNMGRLSFVPDIANLQPPYIVFSNEGIQEKGFRTIWLSRYSMGAQLVQYSQDEFRLSWPTHSDFLEVLEYVDRSNPELVITDNSRSRLGECLAMHISTQLGINALALPSKFASKLVLL